MTSATEAAEMNTLNLWAWATSRGNSSLVYDSSLTCVTSTYPSVEGQLGTLSRPTGAALG